MMLGAWIHAIVIKNTSYVDVLWGYGVGILGFIFLTLANDDCDPARLALLKALLVTWSARLGTYLFRRCRGKPEDARYLYLREWMGEKANFGFFDIKITPAPDKIFSPKSLTISDVVINA